MVLPPILCDLQVPFRHGVLTLMMEQYNFDMSSVRVIVEWLFGDIIKFLDFKRNLKIGMSSVGKMYLVCAPLNAITCLCTWKQNLRVFWHRPSFIAVLF